MSKQDTETQNEGQKRANTKVKTNADLEAKVYEKLKEAQPHVENKGIRKGKMPMAMLKKQFGKNLMGEVMQETIDGAVNSHLSENNVRPAMQPSIKMTNEDWKEGDDVHLEVAYEALPEIPEFDGSKIKLEKMVVKADEASVTEALENLAATAENFKKRRKGSKAREKDQVVMDFVGKVDGEAFEGGSAEDYPLVLGSNSFIPGFEDQLIGAKEGEEVTVEVTFPESYGAENLAGKAATFDCTIKEVREAAPAEINDEMATKFGAEDLEGLKAQISERLEAEYTGASRAVMKRALLDQLDGLVKFDLPPSLVQAEADQIAHQLWHEENPDVQGHDHDKIEPTDEHNKLAERRVRLGLLLADVGQKANVEVTDAEMTQAILAQARQYPGQERQFFEFVQQNQQMQQQLRAPLFEDKVVDLIVEGAKVTEKEVSKDDLQKAIDALEEE
jgi:trigger factor